VKVRRRMVVVIHGDDDAEEAADFRHLLALAGEGEIGQGKGLSF
jgi:hypothetical protein